MFRITAYADDTQPIFPPDYCSLCYRRGHCDEDTIKYIIDVYEQDIGELVQKMVEWNISNIHIESI